MHKLFYILAIALVFSACKTHKNKPTTTDEHTAEYALDYEGVYKGTYPCADCEGIKTTLTLNKDKSFIYETLYLGRKGKSFVYKGNYTVKGNTLTIQQDNKPIHFLVGESTVTLLGDDLKPNTGELADFYVLKKQRGFTYQGLYKGTYPCADCSGIETKLSLQTDNSFVYETVYIDKKDGRFVHKGKYTVKDDILSFKENNKTLNFLIGENILTFLGENLKPNTGKLDAFYILKKQGNFNYQGKYETFNEEKGGYTQTLSIQPKGSDYEIVFSASKVKNRENCRFSGMGSIKNDTLWVNISNEKDKEVLIYIAPSHDNLGVEVFTPNFENRFYMMRYCSGGSSLAGKYIKNTITANSIGVFNQQNTIAEVLQTLPNTQVNKKVGHGEFAEDVYDDYEILNHNFKPLFTINATFGDIKKAYKINGFAPTREHITFNVDEINASFSIAKSKLKKGWWNEKTKKIDESKIPLNTKVDSFILWWYKK